MKMLFNAACLATVLVFGCLLSSCHPRRQSLDDLREELRGYVDTLDAQVGIALLAEGGDTLTVNNSRHYPMMSVFKFHQALAVCDYLQTRFRPQSLDTVLSVAASELRPDTWSPLREKYQAVANLRDSLDMSVRELLQYSLQQSDNNACDILFHRFLSPAAVTGCLRVRAGVEDFHIAFTEEEMGQQHEHCYENWTTPYAAALLMDRFLHTDWLREPYKTFIKETMLACRTGEARLPAPLRETGAVIGHKTGSGYVTADGRITGTNDVGFISLSPDGPRYVLAVFVKDSRYDEPDTEAIIAHVSQLVYAYWKGK